MLPFWIRQLQRMWARLPSAALAVALGLGFSGFGCLFLEFGFFVEQRFDLLDVFLDRRRFLRPRCGDRSRARAFDGHPRAFEALVDHDVDRDSIAQLNVSQLGALLVEDIDRGLAARPKQDLITAPAGGFIFELSGRPRYSFTLSQPTQKWPSGNGDSGAVQIRRAATNLSLFHS